MKKMILSSLALTVVSSMALAAGGAKTTDSSKTTKTTTSSTTDRSTDTMNQRDPSSMKNEVTVAPGVEETTVTRVQEQLRSQPSPAAQNVSVSTANGQLVLTGTVPTQAEKTRILDMAKAQAGNMTIKDEVTVRRE